MPDPIIDISNVDFAYGERLVLKHIVLPVEKGTVVGVIGPNGGGKTTLIKLLTGLLKPTRGTITVAGMAATQAIGRGDIIGYLPQNPRSTPGFPLNVRQFVRLGLAGKIGFLGRESGSDLAHTDDLLCRVGIDDLAAAPIGSLSGGELQRAFIARALAPKPHILLLDEPTTGIDRLGQDRFIDFLRQLKASLALTVVLVSHDLRTVAAVCDRLACLNVTLHYHDVPEHMPQELAREMFGADLAELRGPPSR